MSTIQPVPALQASLQDLLSDARLAATPLPHTSLRLWLIDAGNMQRPFTQEEAQRVMHAPPYWCFCWASGLVLAQWLLERPDWVRGKRVLDFGAGSGVAGIAAARAGAAEVVACDNDPMALQACEANAALNSVTLRHSSDFFAETACYDLILVADVLYDSANLPLLDAFLGRGKQVLVADSRIRNFRHPPYRRIAEMESSTWPDLDESPQFRKVSLYHASRDDSALNIAA